MEKPRRMMRKVVSYFVIFSFALSNIAQAAPLSSDTLRAISLGNMQNITNGGIGSDLSGRTKSFQSKRLSDVHLFMEEQWLGIKKNISMFEFLKDNTPEDLIERLEADKGGKQQFVINVLGLAVSQYMWVYEKYGLASDEMKEIESDVYVPIMECLDKISERIESSDLVPNAVTLRLSEKDETPEVNIAKKVQIGFLPMKGDPWQIGHLWVILKLLAGGYDTVVVMLDNSDPDRKLDLTALPIRKADSAELFRILRPFVLHTSFQEEYRPLFTSDGEIIMPTLIYENKAIAERVIWIYDAGYDHFNWTLSKKGENFLDVPYKLCYGAQELAKRGVNATIHGRFQYRASDSTDTLSQAQDKVKILKTIAKINSIEFFMNTMGVLVDEQGTKAPSQFWADVKNWIAQEKNALIQNALTGLTEEQEQLCREMQQNAAEAIEDKPKNKPVQNWFDRFKKASSWQSDSALSSLSAIAFQALIGIQSGNERFTPQAGDAKNWADEFIKLVSNKSDMDFQVISQPMDTSATKVRTGGKLHIVAGVFFADSTIGLRRYTAFQDPDVAEEDKKITTHILAMLIDPKLVMEGPITEEGLQEHLRNNLSPLVDMSLLLKRLRARLLAGKAGSILYYSNQEFEESVHDIRLKLSQAYGNALHAVGGYLVKFFIEDRMLEELISHIGQTGTGNLELQARERINRIRSLIEERAGIVIENSRKEHLSMTGAADQSAKSFLNNIETIKVAVMEAMEPKMSFVALFNLVQSKIPASMQKLHAALDELKPLSQKTDLTAEDVTDAINQAQRNHNLSKDETDILYLAMTGPGQGMGGLDKLAEARSRSEKVLEARSRSEKALKEKRFQDIVADINSLYRQIKYYEGCLADLPFETRVPEDDETSERWQRAIETSREELSAICDVIRKAPDRELFFNSTAFTKLAPDIRKYYGLESALPFEKTIASSFSLKHKIAMAVLIAA